MDHLFCYPVVICHKDGTIYAYFTGKFHIRSMNRITVMFILYDWTTNAIPKTPVKDLKGETVARTFKENIKYLVTRGFKPVFNIIDNMAPYVIKAYLKEEDIGIQLGKTNNHRANVAVRLGSYKVYLR